MKGSNCPSTRPHAFTRVSSRAAGGCLDSWIPSSREPDLAIRALYDSVRSSAIGKGGDSTMWARSGWS
eukprot:15470983-Alexandrium_andersonii.AAC.1